MEFFVLEIGTALMLAGVMMIMLWKGKPREKTKSTSIHSFEIIKSTSMKSYGSLEVDPSKYQDKGGGSQNTDPESQLKVFQEQMWLALDQFEASDDLQVLWIAVEAELRELDESGTVPETEIESAGLDQNNYDHLCKAFVDIEDQFKEQRYEIALSRLKACRSVFMYSDLHGVQDIFMEDNFTILKLLFFKSYVD